MQAYIKDNKLIINSMIQDEEKENLLDYISKAESTGVVIETLYNTEGNISGIAFKLRKEK